MEERARKICIAMSVRTPEENKLSDLRPAFGAVAEEQPSADLVPKDPGLDILDQRSRQYMTCADWSACSQRV